jgi:hypothetical protein
VPGVHGPPRAGSARGSAHAARGISLPAVTRKSTRTSRIGCAS